VYNPEHGLALKGHCYSFNVKKIHFNLWPEKYNRFFIQEEAQKLLE
jgi:hypothetical protein